MEHLLMLIVCCLFVVFRGGAGENRNFTIDYGKNTFLKDGKPFRYISGSMHYSRVPKCYWRDRMEKMKACGLDAVQTYIPWNFHWVDSSYNFYGQRDIASFLQMAQEVGLLAIIRGLPYSDAELDMGGLPSWLLKSKYNPPDDPIRLRTSDVRFLLAVQDWLDVILPIIKPLLYNNGGPVIMIQVENEYGSYYAQDKVYLKKLHSDIASRLDNNVVLFTTDGDGSSYLKHGGIRGVFQTVDFGSGTNVTSSFILLRKYQPQGPLVNSEFYTGWLDHWGEQHHRTSSEAICTTLNEILAVVASVNFYMFTGGTNFAYWSGSNGPGASQITTSYDYDAPISESGDTTEKYFKIRQVISKYKELPAMPIPGNISAYAYGTHFLTNQGQFWNHIQMLCPNGPVMSEAPMSFEDLDVFGGFVLYSTSVPLYSGFDKNWLQMVFEDTVRDKAVIYVNRIYVGEMVRGQHTIGLGMREEGDKIDILVESKGRICYGSDINDSKGISGKVKLTDGLFYSVWLTNWKMYPLNINNMESISNAFDEGATTDAAPMIYTSTLYLPCVADTFLDLSGGNWTSGYVTVNGFNLGKYEPDKGPQQTLYMPTKALLNGEPIIHVAIFETNPSKMCGIPGTRCTISFVDKPKLG